MTIAALCHILRATLSTAALAVGLTWVCASAAAAHAQSTSAVLLDVQTDQVTGVVQLPIDRLGVGVARDLARSNVLTTQGAFLDRYVADHISASGPDGRRWTVTLSNPRVEVLDQYQSDHLVYDLQIRPPPGVRLTRFALRYDVITEELVTHQVLVAVRYDFGRGVVQTDDAQTLGVLTGGVASIEVPAGQGSWLRGVAATAGVGIDHISRGADHLLFLLMLLIPAPLVIAGGRWRLGGSAKGSALRIVHVVTAFAIGHSLTLALAAAGAVTLPARPVETLIALSIAVSAVHAIRPLAARGEVWIAAGFGLVHGLAFASAIADLGLDRGSLVATLLGFNLGIEATQLFVVALMMPSLLVLARTPIYPGLRVSVGVAGLLFSASWMLERSSLTSSDPFAPLQSWLIDRPLQLAAVTAAIALIANLMARRTTARPTATAQTADVRPRSLTP